MIDDANDEHAESGPWVQVSRLGNPLFNEVDRADRPEGQVERAASGRRQGSSLKYVEHPELAELLPVLYPGVFPNLAELKAKPRADLVAILLTGLPAGIVPGFQNYTGQRPRRHAAAERRDPADASKPNPLGLLGGDLAGFPNGRRVFDDVVTIELRAIAGLTYPLVDPTFTPDAAASLVDPGVVPAPDRYQPTFPYLGTPHDGFTTPPA